MEKYYTNDQEFINAIKNNEEQAPEELWKKIYSFAAYLAKKYALTDQDTINDAANNAYFRALKYIDNYNYQASFSAWIYRIVSNEISRELTRQSRYSTSVLSIDTIELIDENQLIEKSNKDIHDLLLRYIHELPKRTQTILIDLYVQELSAEEVAKHLCLERGTVIVIAHRARQYLRKRLIEDGYKSITDVISQ